ncbi:MAG: HEAT repeat domain-containing protein [Betaproteobacteria bacterium]|nr:HEAT repeat domain-containing protein [Betaproteobacteria bacterium]
MTAPNATLMISSHCHHCSNVLAALTDMVKQGIVGQLTVVNVERHPELADAKHVRSVPWVSIGQFEFTGAQSAAELRAWAERAKSEEGWADYFHQLLKDGQAAQVVELVQAAPERLVAVLPIVENPEASLNVRLGAGLLMEAFAGSAALKVLTARLGEMAGDPDARIRADACHYLGMSGSAEARPYLEARIDDPDAEVREIAQESLAALARA